MTTTQRVRCALLRVSPLPLAYGMCVAYAVLQLAELAVRVAYAVAH